MHHDRTLFMILLVMLIYLTSYIPNGTCFPVQQSHYPENSQHLIVWQHQSIIYQSWTANKYHINYYYYCCCCSYTLLSALWAEWRQVLQGGRVSRCSGSCYVHRRLSTHILKSYFTCCMSCAAGFVLLFPWP